MTTRRPLGLTIDWTRCDGHALCARLVPELVSLDEWGFPRIAGRPLERGEVTAARRAVLACPALALRVERRDDPPPGP
jgi:ferredoxin